MDQLPGHELFVTESQDKRADRGYRKRLAEAFIAVWGWICMLWSGQQQQAQDIAKLQRQMAAVLAVTGIPFTGFTIVAEPVEGNPMAKKLTLVPTFADKTSALDDAHVIPAGVNFPAGVHWADSEPTELTPGATPDVVTFTPDDPNTSADIVTATVDGWTTAIPPFTYQPPVAFTGFKIVVENV